MDKEKPIREYILDILKPAGPFQLKRYFGGLALRYKNDQIGMIMGNTFYLRVNDITRENFILIGGKPFSYKTKKGRITVHKYYSVPEYIINDKKELQRLVATVIDVKKQLG